MSSEGLSVIRQALVPGRAFSAVIGFDPPAAALRANGTLSHSAAAPVAPARRTLRRLIAGPRRRRCGGETSFESFTVGRPPTTSSQPTLDPAECRARPSIDVRFPIARAPVFRRGEACAATTRAYRVARP